MSDAPAGSGALPAAETLRRRLVERMRLSPTAWSVDGAVFAFRASHGDDLPTGGYVVIDVGTDAGAGVGRARRRVVGQVHERHEERAPVGTFSLDWGALGEAGDELAGVVQGVEVALPVRVVSGAGTVLAAVAEDGTVDPRPPAVGFADADLAPAPDDLVEQVLAARRGGAPTLALGRLVTAPEREAPLRAKGITRHTFLCGQSGSGKTYATGVLLERVLLQTDLPLLVLDPNSDHVHLGRLRDDAPADDAERARHGREAGRVRVASRGGSPPLRGWFSDLAPTEQALVLGLDPVGDLEEHHALLQVVAGLPSRHGVSDVREAAVASATEEGRRLALRIDNLGLAGWSLWADPADDPLAGLDDDRRALVLDLGSLAEPRERAVAALMVLGRLRRRPERRPVLVVVDEAHTFCPPTSPDPVVAATTSHLVWLAGEGRKYGLHLLVVSQRPAKVHPDVVSQCDNLVLMRLNGERDAAALLESFSHVPAGLVALAPSLRQGQAVVAGPLAGDPLLLQVRDRLTPEGGADLPTDWLRPGP
ncbi:ATP-binding protein [Aquipuribacter sp. SD81]|uniref:ATP-binding protein n=1 Tax=Aquipuribacter sp. SD81 TaxID=3127703 RepID=UPI00301829C2